jgi:hypothetical protein
VRLICVSQGYGEIAFVKPALVRGIVGNLEVMLALEGLRSDQGVFLSAGWLNLLGRAEGHRTLLTSDVHQSHR